MTKPTLDDLFEELQRGRIYECSLRDPKWVYEGVTDAPSNDRATIWIDVRPCIIEVLIHELMHRRFPAMTERQVLRESRRLVMKLRSEKDKARWWRAYRRIARKRRPVQVDE